MTKEEYLLLLDDDGKLKRKFINKNVNAKKEGLKCLLSFDEFCQLLINAGLKSSDIGFTSPRKIVLARYNDEGDYTFDNCRFITQHENMIEQKTSEKSSIASANNAKTAREKNLAHREEWIQSIRNGQKNSEKMNEKRKKKLQAEEEKRLRIERKQLEALKKKAEKEALKKERMENPYRPQSIPVSQFTRDGEYIKTFPSIAQAILALSNPSALRGWSHISDVCKGRRKTAYGYIWKFANQ